MMNKNYHETFNTILFTRLQKILPALLIFSFFSSGYSQGVRQSFNGPYRLTDSLPGNAAFEYRLDGRDTLKDGRFNFQHFVEHHRDTDSIFGMVLTGYFLDNIKNGPWYYSSKKLAIVGGIQTLGARVVYDASGNEFLASANFSEGKVEGDYELVNRNIVNSVPGDTTFFSRMQYHDGKITGKLTGFESGMTVNGQFDAEGFPDGDWVFVHHNDSARVEEIRRYDRGFFSRHYYRTDDRLLEIKHVGFDTLAKAGRGLLTRLPATAAYFRALDYTDIVMDTLALGPSVKKDDFSRHISRANAFLQRVFTRPADYQVQNIWKSVEGSDSIPPVRVKISKFGFSERELGLNRDNDKVLSEIQSQIRHFFGHPEVDLGRFTNKQIGLFYAVLKIYEEQLARLSPVVRFLADEASEYVDHFAILDHHAIKIHYPATVDFELQDSLVSLNHSFPADLKAFNTREINHHLAAIFDDVSGIASQVEGLIAGFQAQSALKDREKNLLSLRDSVTQLYFNKEAAHNTLQLEIRDSVGASIEKAFKTYAGMNTFQRLQEVEGLEACFRRYSELYTTLAVYQDKMHELDKEYTRSVWNPYTFTNMDERVKERLYTAFEEVLYPAAWKSLSLSPDCENLAARLKNLNNLLNRMAELRMEDTKEIERKIRKSKADARNYAAILGLNPDIY